jgi:methyl-accepting chemotaxis protein
MKHLDQLTGRNANASEELAASSVSMKNTAVDLLENMEFFTLK